MLCYDATALMKYLGINRSNVHWGINRTKIANIATKENAVTAQTEPTIASSVRIQYL